MASFNNFSVVKRWNRPSVLMKTLLETFFTNNGTYFKPYSVSTVYILPDTSLTNGSPDIYINRQVSDMGTQAYGLLNASSLSSVQATFGGDISLIDLNPSAYSGAGTISASGIYSGSTSADPGHFQVVLDGSRSFLEFSAVGKYFDVWLVKDFEDAFDTSSGWQLYWNKFEVFSDRIVTFTEPYQVTTKNKLSQKYLQLSSIPTLRITTDVFLANRNMSRDLKDIWREQVIDNAEIRIMRRNPRTSGLISKIVPGTGPTQGDWSRETNVSSENTITFTWDTTQLEAGDYFVQCKYTLLEQTFVSEEFSLVLR
tara:strand:+ start:9626 stop:10561 length:936 start_codon:yes stop_codon:yes gene_type:complete